MLIKTFVLMIIASGVNINNIDKKYQHKKEIIFKNSLQAIKACLSGIGFFVTEKLLIENISKIIFYIFQNRKSLQQRYLTTTY